MKPAQERNQECLPPKKRDLLVNNSGGGGAGGGGAGGTGGGSSAAVVGEDEVVPVQGSGASSDPQGAAASGEWLQTHPGLHYGGENSDGVPAVPVDQYSMLYKVALPSVTYAPTTLHPVLSHISSAYTVHSPLLQHPGLPYPPLGYAQIPHSSLQFVSSPYTAVPYALPPGFVPGSLISASGAIPQPHTVSHLVPYQSVIQEGVVSPPPQAQVSAHTFAKVAASGAMMLSSEQAAQQHLGAVGVLPAKDVSPRGMPVLYHAQGARAAIANRDAHASQHETEPEMNGREPEQGMREALLEPGHLAKNTRLEHGHDRGLLSRRLEERSSPGQPGTPDSDLEVQQVVGRLASSNHGAGGVRKEVSFAPLNLSQAAPRARNVQKDPVSYGDPRVGGLQQPTGPPGHAVLLANGQPVLVPLEYSLQHQLQAPQQHYAGQANHASAGRASPTAASSNPSFKASDSSARVCLPDRAEPAQAPPQRPDAAQAPPPSLAPAPAGSNPSHFMKGAIIQLATGELKRVEDLQTHDFMRSAEVSGGLKIDSSMVVDVRASQQRPGLVSLQFTVGEQQSKVTIDVPPEHPFFVFGQGWSSCSPERTAQLYGLACHHLQVGDVCVSITLQPPSPPPQKPPEHHHAQQQQQQQQSLARTISKIGATPGPVHQLMGPPAPQQARPQSHFRVHRDRSRDGDKDGDREDAAHFGVAGHNESPLRPSRTPAEHPRGQGGYLSHAQGAALAGAGMAPVQASLGASQRRWSSPGLQRYNMKGDEGLRPQISTSGHSRPSFIPQEVKLSIEGRSNAGK